MSEWNKKEYVTELATLLEKKTDDYCVEIGKKLNALHRMSLSQNFWNKVLYVPLNRYVTIKYSQFLYDMSFGHSQLEDQNRNYSETIPLTFDELRETLQAKSFTYQLDKSTQKNAILKAALRGGGQNTTNNRGLSKYSFAKKIINKLKKPKVISPWLKATLIEKLLAKDRIKVGLLGVLFDKDSISRLAIETGGKINVIKKITVEDDIKSNVQVSARCEIFNWHGSDFLDKFIFDGLGSIFPKLYIEHFPSVVTKITNHLQKYKKLRYVVSETWPSDDMASLHVALLQEIFKVKHIYNEHNYIEHPYVGSLLDKTIGLSDIFLSLGWTSQKYKNLIPCGSLFKFGSDLPKVDKKYKITYVSGAAIAIIPQYSGSYGFSGPYVHNYMKMFADFFENIQDKTLNEVHYREYPRERLTNVAHYDKEYILKERKSQFKSYSISGGDIKKLMRQSELVVIDYISTSYLECLVMNIPVIVLYDKESYHLKNEYLNFFSDLVEAGIFQADPKSAAQFVERVKDDPCAWWRSEKTQNARKDFLSKNLRDGFELHKYLVSCALG